MKMKFFKKFWTNKRFRYGGYATILTLVVIAACVLLSIGTGALESKFGLKLDLTHNGRFTLQDQSLEVLKTIDEPVNIYYMTTEGSESTEISQLIARYTYQNPNVKTSTVDPERNPAFTRNFQKNGETIAKGSVVIASRDDTKYKILGTNDFYQYDQETGAPTTFIAEYTMTSALVYVTADYTPKVYFLTGHEETQLSLVPYLEQYLRAENYDVASLTLLSGTQTLEKGDCVVVLAPTKDLSDDERNVLKDFLDNGGRMMYAVDPNLEQKKLENFESLLKLFYIELEDGMVIEDSAQTNQYYQNPTLLVPTLQNHPITNALIANKLALLIPGGRGIIMPEGKKSTYQIYPLMQTSKDAYNKVDLSSTSVERAEGDKVGTYVLGATSEHLVSEDEVDNGRVVVLGNSLFATKSDFVRMSGNLDFFISCIKWMSSQKVNISVYTKSITEEALNITSQMELTTLMGIVMVAIPLLILISGAVVYFRRRHL